MQIGAYFLTLTLDILNLKSVVCDTESRTIAVRCFRSFRSGIHTQTPTHTYIRTYSGALVAVW